MKLGRIPQSASFWGRFSLESPTVLPPVCEVLGSVILPHTAPGRRDVLCPIQQTTVIHRWKKSMLLTKLLKDFRFSAAALVFGDQNNASN